MSDVRVSQEDLELRKAILSYIVETLAQPCLDGDMIDDRQDALDRLLARHRLATRPAPVGEPVAWMYELGGNKHFFGVRQSPRINGIAVDMWIETPLYTRPALDVEGLVAALRQCGEQFAFYAREHTAAGKLEKAATNQRFADLALAAIKDATDA